MSALFFSTIFLLAAPATSGASAKTPAAKPVIPIHVQYLKTGREDPETSNKLGQEELDNSNPCVGKMRRDLLELGKRQEIHDAVDSVAKTFSLNTEVRPHLVLRYMNEAMELRFEMRSIPVKNNDGKIVAPETVMYRKAIFLSEIPGTWQERIDGEKCHVSEERFTALVDELREADRLAACVMRKKEILDGSEKISNYIHNYLPVSWLEEARKKLVEKNEPANGLLRDDQSTYRQGNTTFRDCQRGLRLLEEDASSSVRVLNEVRDAKKGTDVPSQELDDLEHVLSGIPK
jgi:hypothetical protein